MAVTLFHTVAANHVTALVAVMPAWLLLLLHNGHLGVAIFFVLSGFVISLSLDGRDIDLHSALRFMARRSLRLDPPYWVAIALALVAAALASRLVTTHAEQAVTGGQIVAHLLYLQEILGYREINPVFWTLCLEFQFYLVYITVMAQRQAPMLLLAGGAISLLWPLGLAPDLPPGLFLPQWHGFLLGVAANATLKGRLKPVVFAAFAGLAFLGSCLSGDPFSGACAVSAGLIVVVGRAGRLGDLLNWRWLQALGVLSYSLYLVHNPVTGASFRVAHLLLRGAEPSPLLDALAWLASLLACLAAAALLWALAERPSMRLAQRIAMSRRTGPAGAQRAYRDAG